MILKFKRAKPRKGAAFACLLDEVLAEGVEVRAVTPKATTKVKTLDEITDTPEFVAVCPRGIQDPSETLTGASFVAKPESTRLHEPSQVLDYFQEIHDQQAPAGWSTVLGFEESHS